MKSGRPLERWVLFYNGTFSAFVEFRTSVTGFYMGLSDVQGGDLVKGFVRITEIVFVNPMPLVSQVPVGFNRRCPRPGPYFRA